MKKKISKKIVFTFLCLLVMIQGNLWAQDFDPTENIALGKNVYASSVEDRIANIVDGNNGTSWQGANNDDEWFYIDLGDVYDLDRIEILWEAAYAKSFSLSAVSHIPTGHENADWELITPIIDETISDLSQSYDVNGTGRYIKFQGIERALPYGYCIFEFRVFATNKRVVENPVLTSVTVSRTSFEMKENEEVAFNISASNQIGGAYENVTIETIIKDADGVSTGADVEYREGRYYLRGHVEGEYTLEVIAKDNSSDIQVQTLPIPVNISGGRRIETLSIALPGIYIEDVLAVIGRGINLTLTSIDQYGENFNPGIEWVIEGEGSVVNNSFIPAKLGISKIYAKYGNITSNEIEIETVATGGNLALNKDVEGTGGNPERAVDGNDGSAWEHPHENDGNYDAWITVDLGEVYERLDLIEVYWEGACSADYIIYSSKDNDQYEPLHIKEDVVGGNGMNQIHQFSTDVSARYIKIHSTKAATGWGIKIFEIRIFGYVPMVIEEEGNHIILSGVWDEDDFKAIDNVNVTSYDLKQITGIAVRPDTKNPNCLIYVNPGSILAGQVNVIAGERAESIILQDGYSYRSLFEFNAGSAEYTRDFTTMNGWATLYIPFDVPLNGLTVEQFASYEEDATSIHFEEVGNINANTPYILKVDNQTGSITFKRENTTVFWEDIREVERGGFTFKGTYTTIPVGEEKLIMKADGSEFAVTAKSAVGPFRGYIVANDGNYSLKSLSIIHDGEDDITTISSDTISEYMRVWAENGLLQIISAIDQIVYVYSVEGRLIGKVEVNVGYNAVEGLSNGIYIVNNQKVVIK